MPKANVGGRWLSSLIDNQNKRDNFYRSALFLTALHQKLSI
jgi:hypothetical protein